MKNLKTILFSGAVLVGLIILGVIFYQGNSPLGYAYNTIPTVSLSVTTTADNLQSVDLRGKQNLTIAVVGASATSMIKFVGSVQNTIPNPLATVSATNQWGYVQLTDLDTGATVNGSTGLELTVGTTTKMYKLTQTNLTYLMPIVTSFTTGTASVMIFSDEGSNR
jgi:hypothetical protein